jgi:hypothetical protein
MTQYSIFWQTPTTGDGASAITQTQALKLWQSIMGDLGANVGALLPHAGLGLSPYVDVGQVSLYAGAGFVKGFFYVSDTTEDLTITTPVVDDTGFRVVLRGSGGTTRTVRLAVLMSEDGVAAIPSLTQDAGFPDTASTVWEFPLFQGVIDTSGVIWTDSGKTTAGVTDERVFVSLFALAARQGGDQQSWNSPGTDTYQDHDQKVQMGCAEMTFPGGATQYSDELTITFPVAFDGIPQMQATAYILATGIGVLVNVKTISMTDAVLVGWKPTVDTSTVRIFWMATGPGFANNPPD